MTEVLPQHPTLGARIFARIFALLQRPGTWVVLGAAAVLLPMLGSAGLWDPWETHYAEVARRMVADGDWLTPRWRNELFFSKPVLIFWMMASSFSVFGANAWAARLPFVLLAILGVWLGYRLVRRATDERRGLWAALVLLTAPFTLFIGRQAVTDGPFVVFILGTLSCFMAVATEEKPRLRDQLGIYIFAALAALAKTPMGLAIPGVAVLMYLLISGDWRVFKRLRLEIGIPLFILLAGPWYVAMVVKYGSKFFNEFFMHHNLQRAFTGVHGDRGTFEYFVKQLGYGFFPWVAMLPMTLGRIGASFRERKTVAALRLGGPTKETAPLRLDLFLSIWFLTSFVAFSLVVTKFHHYIYPAMPPLALLVGLTLADTNEGGWRFLAPLGGVLLAIVANDVVANPEHLSNLCTYAYDRPLPTEIYPRWSLLAISVLFGGMLVSGRWLPGRWLPKALGTLGLVFAIVFSWFYLVPLGHTMSQQDLFETYARVAKQPEEKLYQYQMNWRGEVYHSADTIIKISSEAEVQRIFKKDTRSFIIAIRDGFSAVDRAFRKATGKHMHVLSGSNIRYVLASNQLDPGEEDLNPLAKNVFSEPPNIPHPLHAEWAEGVEFLGWALDPDEPETGDRIALTFFFRCKKEIKKNWKIFIHIDGHGHELHRINGDHHPVEGLFPTDHWLPGDIIRDKVVLHIPIEFTPTNYHIYMGFYIGDKRMNLLPGAPSDGKNRLRAGTIRIK
ncbi:MAG: glycosyltransferase family 39 protein [Deltaproteobacteria bacterium]|nr:glycosyltransferase family 39 protein [Deltaproteobacteria bacterium]